MSKERELLKAWMRINPLMCDLAYAKVSMATKELLAEPEPEPDYYLWFDKVYEEHPTNDGDPDVYPLYLSAPPKREPINLFNVVQEFENIPTYKVGFMDGIKYAEKAHGI